MNQRAKQVVTQVVSGLLLGGLAGAASAAAFAQLSIVGRNAANTSDPFTSTLTVTPGESIQYEILVKCLTSVGATYSNDSIPVASGTILGGLNNDGVQAIASFNLLQVASTGVQFSFDGTDLGTQNAYDSTGGGNVMGDWSVGTGNEGGGRLARGSTGYYDLQGVRLVRQTSGTVNGQKAFYLLTTNDLALQGNFTVKVASSGSAQLNGDMLGLAAPGPNATDGSLNPTGSGGATTSGVRIKGLTLAPNIDVSDGTLNANGTRTLPAGNDPAFVWVPLTLNAVAGAGNDSVLNPSVTTVNLTSAGTLVPDSGKVIAGDPIASQNVTVSRTAGTQTGHFTLANTGSATSSGGNVDVSTTPVTISVGSTAAAGTGNQTLGTVVVHNTLNTGDADKTITLSATVISPQGAAVIGAGTIALPNGGRMLQGGQYSGTFSATNNSGYPGTVSAVSITDGTIGSGGAVPNGGTLPISYTIHAPATGSTVSGSAILANAATDSAKNGVTGSTQPQISSSFNIFTQVAATDSAGTTFSPTYGSNVLSATGYAGLSLKSGNPRPSPSTQQPTNTTLLSGGTGANGSVTMAYRQATAGELAGTPSLFSPLLHSPSPLVHLVSDVVDVEGISGNTVLQMSFDPTTIANLPITAQRGNIEIAQLVSGVWTPVTANRTFFGVGSVPSQSTLAGLSLGTFGVDLTNNLAWEVVNSSGQYAVVPEPATLGLLGLSALGLTIRRRRRIA